MDNILATFPTVEQRQDNYRSFVFQPDKISINSFQDKNINPDTTTQYQQETYSSFQNQLINPALHVKSLQLNRATIPLPTTSIPNNECVFLYRRCSHDTVSGQPVFNELKSWQSIRMIRLVRTDIYSENDPVFYDNSNNPTKFGFNKVFADYQDLVFALNKSAQRDPLQTFNLSSTYLNYYVPNDIVFHYDETMDKIYFTPNALLNNTPYYYFTEIGYEDPDIPIFLKSAEQALGLGKGELSDLYQPLNVRLGFPWNGVIDKTKDSFPTLISYRMRPVPDYSPPLSWSPILNYYAQSYANLIHTHNIFLYADIVGGSSEDTNSDSPLLAVIPVSTAQLGNNTFESKLSNPLTKVPHYIYAINIKMKTDTNSDFVLPNSAPVNIELSLSY